jgi:PEP-CTERM motif
MVPSMRAGYLLGVAILTVVPAFPGLIPVSGVDFLSTPPADVLTLSSDTAAFVWQEQNQLTLPQDVTVNVKDPGVYGCTTPPCTVPVDTGTIPAGTVVNSYYLHFEPVSQPVRNYDFLQSVMTFDQREQVLGVVFVASDLRSSDLVFQPVGSTYPTSTTIGGLELGTQYDRIQLTTNGLFPRNAFGFFGAANLTTDRFDDLRIITAIAPAPEPAGLWLMGTGLVALVCWRKRRLFSSQNS